MAWANKIVFTVALNSCGKSSKFGRPLFYLQRASIASINSGKDISRPPPYPYKEKSVNLFRAWFDGDCRKRFNENTKLIVVDGPILAGKTKVCEGIAKEFDMCYLPAVDMDKYYTNEYGFDERKLDPKLPDSIKSCDFEKMHLKPSLRNCLFVEIAMYRMRYEQYIDALAHILNTGQGVVLERNPWSDFVFIEALKRQGFISKAGEEFYKDVLEHTIPDLLRPHLVIYLDVAPNVILERVKERNLHWEVNSKVINEKFLNDIESCYKNKYLQEMNPHSELLVYDFSHVTDLEVEVLLEDVERVNFDKYDKYDKKLRDWRMDRKWDWNGRRVMYSSALERKTLLGQLEVPNFDITEVIIDGVDALEWLEVLENAPGNKYHKGYNPDMGDKNILFKW